MRFNIKNIKEITILVISIFLVVSCSTQRNFLKEEKYIVKEVNTPELKIELTNVYAKNDSFVVFGKISRIRSFSYHAISGHVDVVIRDSQGDDIEQLSVSKSSPFLKYRRKNSSFKASFSSVPPIGSTIIVGFHKKKIVMYEEFDCGGNVADIKATTN